MIDADAEAIEEMRAHIAADTEMRLRMARIGRLMASDMNLPGQAPEKGN